MPIANLVAVFFAGSLGGESVEDVTDVTFNTWKIGADHSDCDRAVE